MDDLFEQALGDIQGGLVLDVATGWGGFRGVLVSKLGGYTRIVGTDISTRMLAGAPETTNPSAPISSKWMPGKWASSQVVSISSASPPRYTI